MDKHDQLGPWLRRCLLEHMVQERNLSHNTQHSYRDTLPYSFHLSQHSYESVWTGSRSLTSQGTVCGRSSHISNEPQCECDHPQPATGSHSLAGAFHLRIQSATCGVVR